MEARHHGLEDGFCPPRRSLATDRHLHAIATAGEHGTIAAAIDSTNTGISDLRDTAITKDRAWHQRLSSKALTGVQFVSRTK